MLVVGVDEVGRGCWAGPLVAGAVILDKPIPGLKDSKKLSKLKRTRLDAQIRVEALDFGLGWVSPDELDRVGLTMAVRLAMQRAVEKLTQLYDEVIVDGSFNFLSDNTKSRCLIAADNLIPEVSAASIIAKVARDNYMIEQAKKFPEYKFESNVGYGTKAHQQALKENGICILHRRSFAPVKQQ